MKRRLLALAVGLLIVAAVLLWWRRGSEASWSLTVRADRPIVTRWGSVAVEATIVPPAVYGSGSGWTFEWPAGVEGVGHRVRWKVGGTVGPQQLTVKVISPANTVQTASVTVDVVASQLPLASRPLEVPDRDELAPGLEGDAPFWFANVDIEKDAVCQGEESLITLTPGFDDEEIAGRLRPQIGRHLGWSVPFQSFGSEPEIRKVQIRLQDEATGQMITTYADIEVKECIAPVYMIIEKRRDPTSVRPEFVVFHARVRPGPAMHEYVTTPTHLPDGRRKPEPTLASPPARYLWDFGDGTQLVTTEADWVRHQYPAEEEREEDTPRSHYLVVVKAVDAAGNVMATARATVSFENLYRNLKTKSQILQLAEKFDAHPKEDEDGRKYIDVALFNWDTQETATLKTLTARDVPCDNLDGPASEPTEYPLTSVFDKVVVGPKERLQGRAYIDPQTMGPGKTCIRQFKVQGMSAPGDLDVLAMFRMTAGSSAKPKRDVAPEQLELLLRVRRITGKNRITGEDVARLEREGKIPNGSFVKLTTPAQAPRQPTE